MAGQPSFSDSFSFVPPRTFFLPNFCAIPTRTFPTPEVNPIVPAAATSKRTRKKPSKPATDYFNFKENVPQKFVPLLLRSPTLLIQQPSRTNEDCIKTDKFKLVAITKSGSATKFVPLNKITFPPPTLGESDSASKSGLDTGDITKQFYVLNETLVEQRESPLHSSSFSLETDECDNERLVECCFSLSNPSAKRGKPKGSRKAPAQPRMTSTAVGKKAARKKEVGSQLKKAPLPRRPLLLPQRLCPKDSMINFQTIMPMHEMNCILEN